MKWILIIYVYTSIYGWHLNQFGPFEDENLCRQVEVDLKVKLNADVRFSECYPSTKNTNW